MTAHKKNCCSIRSNKNNSQREIIKRDPTQRKSESPLSVPFFG